MRVIVTGSRNWTDYGPICDRLARLPEGPHTIVHGANGVKQGQDPTKSADAIADWAARHLGLEVEPHEADWSRGRKAGPERNQRMVDAGASLCLAFPMPDSRGTWDCVNRAKKAGIPVEVIQGGTP